MELKLIIRKSGAFFEGKSPDILKRNLTEAMYEATQLLEREVKKRTPQGVYGAQGGLISTIHGEVLGKGKPVVKGIVGHQSKYGDVIEKGRRPRQKWPPEGALIRWMEVKLGMDSRSARKIEFVMRRKIGKKGFSGVHMFATALEKNESKLEKIFDGYGFKIATEIDGK